MIGVPRKLSVCLFERNLLLGLKTKALTLSKDSSFKGGSFPKLWPDWVWVCPWSRNISETLFEGTEWHQGRFLSLVLCGGWGDICRHEWAEQCGSVMPRGWICSSQTCSAPPSPSKFVPNSELRHLRRPILWPHPTSPPLLLTATCVSRVCLMATQLTALLPCHGDVGAYNVLPL